MQPFFSRAFRWHITPFGEAMSNASPISRIDGGKPRFSILSRMKSRISCCRFVMLGPSAMTLPPRVKRSIPVSESCAGIHLYTMM